MPFTAKKLFRTLWFASSVMIVSLPFAHAQPNAGDHFGDWTYECQSLNSNETVCALTQTLIIKDRKSRILKLTLRKLGPQENLTLIALLPLGIYLPANAAGKIDGGEQFPLTMRTCTALGCEAVTQVDRELRWKMKAGNKLYIGFLANPDTETTIVHASLRGISSGLEALGFDWRN